MARARRRGVADYAAKPYMAVGGLDLSQTHERLFFQSGILGGKVLDYAICKGNFNGSSGKLL